MATFASSIACSVFMTENFSGASETRPRRRQERRLRRLVTDTLRRRLEVAIGKPELDTMVARIQAREIDPHAAADALVEIGLRRTASLGVAPAERRTHGE